MLADVGLYAYKTAHRFRIKLGVPEAAYAYLQDPGTAWIQCLYVCQKSALVRCCHAIIVRVLCVGSGLLQGVHVMLVVRVYKYKEPSPLRMRVTITI